jgi:hypothetical protein
MSQRQRPEHKSVEDLAISLVRENVGREEDL